MARDQRSGPNVTPITPLQAQQHLRKAEEYLRTAQAALAAGDLDAAGGNAVLAGINAADSVSGMLQGTRWSGAHEQAAAHVQKAGPDGKAVATQLRKLVRKKTQTHYEVTRLTPAQARGLVEAAERAVSAARRAVAQYEAR